MLHKYKQLKISEYSSLYDIVVTPDNLLSLRRTCKELRKEIYVRRPELAEKFPKKPDNEDSLDDEITYVNELINVLENEIMEEDHKKLKNRYRDKGLELRL